MYVPYGGVGGPSIDFNNWNTEEMASLPESDRSNLRYQLTSNTGQWGYNYAFASLGVICQIGESTRRFTDDWFVKTSGFGLCLFAQQVK